MLLPYVIWEKSCCTKAFLVINWLLKLCSCTNHSQKQKQNGSLTKQYYFFMLIFLVLHLMTSCHAGLLKQIVHVNMTNDLVPREDHTFHVNPRTVIFKSTWFIIKMIMNSVQLFLEPLYFTAALNGQLLMFVGHVFRCMITKSVVEAQVEWWFYESSRNVNVVINKYKKNRTQ